MQSRTPTIRSVPAFLVWTLFAAGCAGPAEPVGPLYPQHAAPTATVQAAAGQTSVPRNDGETVLVIQPGSSQVRYRAKEQLVGVGFNEPVGSTSGVTGQVVLNKNGSVAKDRSRLTVDLRSLKSDSPQRDNFIQNSTLQTRQFPTADLVVTEIQGLGGPLPESGTLNVMVVGELTVHGVTKPSVWTTTAQVNGNEVSGLASTKVNITDFGMTPPKAGPVLSIEDDLILEITFKAQRGAPAT